MTPFSAARQASLALSILTLTLGLVFESDAAERLAVDKVDPDAFVDDSQVSLRGGGDDHTSMVWWVSSEFWESILSRDTNTGDDERREVLRALEGVTLLAVVQSDISPLGSFDYYEKDEVSTGMSVTFAGENGKTRKLETRAEVGKDLQMVLSMLKPVLEAAMGELGSNMHFYVLDDRGEEGRLVDPYATGKISIALTKRNKDVIEGTIRLPLNSLFVPRKCPNGEDADITWAYCPWTGAKLD